MARTNRLGLVRALVGLKGIKQVKLKPGRKKAKSKAKAKPKARKKARAKALGTFNLHNGQMGNVTAANLLHEGEWACRSLVHGKKLMLHREWHGALDAFFKASAVATNVLFAARVHGVKLPEECVKDMNTVISQGTGGIKNIMSLIARKKINVHEKREHGIKRGRPKKKHGLGKPKKQGRPRHIMEMMP